MTVDGETKFWHANKGESTDDIRLLFARMGYVISWSDAAPASLRDHLQTLPGEYRSPGGDNAGFLDCR